MFEVCPFYIWCSSVHATLRSDGSVNTPPHKKRKNAKSSITQSHVGRLCWNLTFLCIITQLHSILVLWHDSQNSLSVYSTRGSPRSCVNCSHLSWDPVRQPTYVHPHVQGLARRCFYHIRQLRSARRSLTTDSAKTLVHALIASRLDYCNSVLYQINTTATKTLQSVLHSAAR